MSLQILPEELLDMIGRRLSQTRKEMFNSYDTKLSRTNMYKIYACNRIKLWFKIMSRYKRLTGYILSKLKRICWGVWVADLGVSVDPQYRGCIYYAPHIPGGMCRHCCKYRIDHRFSPKLIETFYFSQIDAE